MNRVKHPFPTRLVHVILALSVLLQLCTSAFMKPARNGDPANWLFYVHEISGLIALLLAFCFWLIIAARRRGTPARRLFPWSTGTDLAALVADAVRHLKAARRLGLPTYQEHSPLPSAVHGLGLILMSAMAATGAVWLTAQTFGLPPKSIAIAAMTAHHIMANLVWAYLIGHAAFAILHHLTGEASLLNMWSLKPGK